MKVLILGGTNSVTEAIIEELLSIDAEIIFVGTGVTLNIQHSNFLQPNLTLDSSSDDIYRYLKQQAPFYGVVYAYGTGGVRPIKLNSDDFIQDMFDKNVFLLFRFMRSLSRRGIIADGGSIVAISSISSIKGLKSKTAYSASKAALDAAIRGFAAELAPRKIRVNSIQKGWVTSDMNLDFIKSNMSLSEQNDFNEQLLGAIEPDELGFLVSCMLSKRLSSLTGKAIILDGGYTL